MSKYSDRLDQVTTIGVKELQDIRENFFNIFLTVFLVTIRDDKTGEDLIVLESSADDNEKKMLFISPQKFISKVVSLQRQRNKMTNPSAESEFYVGVKGIGEAAAQFFPISSLAWLERVQALFGGLVASQLYGIAQAIHERPPRKKARKKTVRIKRPPSTENVIPFPKKKGKRRR